MTMEKGEVKMKRRSGLMLVVAVLLVLTGCRTATPRNWSYQWDPETDGRGGRLFAVNQATGDVAEWRRGCREWESVFNVRPHVLDEALKRLDTGIKEREEEFARVVAERAAARVNFAKMSLAEQVEKALGIGVLRYSSVTDKTVRVGQHPAQGVVRVVRRHPASGMLGWSISEAIKEVENLGWVVSVDNFLKRDCKEGDVTVAFLVRPESVENEIVVYLSNTLAPDNDMVFYAPASIVEDVKAEVERQKALKGEEGDR